jgi:hypothetical protein
VDPAQLHRLRFDLEVAGAYPQIMARQRAQHDAVLAERDRIYAEQARRYPGFAEYERKTAGIRVIPVLELRRA